LLLRERPTGRIEGRTFELVEETVSEIGEGEALGRARWISPDRTNRAWIGDTLASNLAASGDPRMTSRRELTSDSRAPAGSRPETLLPIPIDRREPP
jgi:hypothetical protein